MVHRDIRPENILVETKELGLDGLIKIIDFGYVQDVEEENLQKLVLEQNDYTAPECLELNGNNFYDNIVSCKSDIWSCGILLYILLSGRKPFS